MSLCWSPCQLHYPREKRDGGRRGAERYELRSRSHRSSMGGARLRLEARAVCSVALDLTPWAQPLQRGSCEALLSRSTMPTVTLHETRKTVGAHRPLLSKSDNLH